MKSHRPKGCLAGRSKALWFGQLKNMRIFTIYLRRHGLDPEKDIVVLKDGFSWPAFLVGSLWALWHGMWWVALGLMIGAGVINGLGPLIFSDTYSTPVLVTAFALLSGMLASDLRVWTLERQGFVLGAVVSAESPETALRRYLDEDAGLAHEINWVESRI